MEDFTFLMNSTGYDFIVGLIFDAIFPLFAVCGFIYFSVIFFRRIAHV